MTIWVVSREYAGIAEAGGVKNVTCSLCQELDRSDCSVTCFLPFYGCTSLQHIEQYRENILPPADIQVCGRSELVSFCSGMVAGTGVRVIFICSPYFKEKQGIYTYTEAEQAANPLFEKGKGHRDFQILNVLFQKAVIAFGVESNIGSPDIIHCQDAAAALVPVFMRQSNQPFFKKTKCVVTIHNAGPCYHHEFASMGEAVFYTGLPESVLTEGMNGSRIEPFLLAAHCSVLTTVSPEYARELLENETDTDGLASRFAAQGTAIFGITNGIDYDQYDPSDTGKSLLPFVFDPSCNDFTGKIQCRQWFLENIASEKNGGNSKYSTYMKGIERFGWINPHCRVFLSYHGRIVHQKGIQILSDAAGSILERFPEACFIVAGQGELELEKTLSLLAGKYTGRFVYFRGYNKRLSRLCTAAGDFILLPSLFEPCGLEDMIAQIYGTVPVASRTGGLNKIIDGKSGFLFSPVTVQNLIEKTSEEVVSFYKDPASFCHMAVFAAQNIKTRYSWKNVVYQQYLPLYHKMLAEKR